MSSRVCVVGYASLDYGGEIRDFRGVDATSIVTRGLRDGAPGIGGVAHIARAAVATGVQTSAISWIGPDDAGRRWVDALAASGTASAGVAVTGSRTPNATMIEIATGGTICLFDPGDCYPDTLTVAQRRSIADGGLLVLTVAPRALTTAILDELPAAARLAWAVKHDDNVYTPELMTRVLARADLVSFSRGERSYVFPDGDVTRVRRGTLLIETRGAEGVAWSLAGVSNRSGVTVVSPIRGVDTTGAGDTFVGTLAGLVAQSPPLIELSDEEIDALIVRSTASVADLLRRRREDRTTTYAIQKENV